MIGAKTCPPQAALPVGTRRAARFQIAHGVLGYLALLLAVAVVLQLLPYPKSAVVKRSVPLGDYFPRSMSGWHSEDRPLAETEAAEGAVREILNYDEALLRTYKKDGREFSLYVAYWQPGKMSAHEIAFHVPDKCWPAVGWKRIAADYHYQPAGEGRLLAPAQYREFQIRDQLAYVLYWHVFNGRVVLYNPDGVPTRLSKLSELFTFGLHQKGEQYFIRITSPDPLEQVANDDGFQEILELIAPLGPGLHLHVEHFDDAP